MCLSAAVIFQSATLIISPRRRRLHQIHYAVFFFFFPSDVAVLFFFLFLFRPHTHTLTLSHTSVNCDRSSYLQLHLWLNYACCFHHSRSSKAVFYWQLALLSSGSTSFWENKRSCGEKKKPGREEEKTQNDALVGTFLHFCCLSWEHSGPSDRARFRTW